MNAIDDLPVEILTDVFLVCVPYPTRDNPGPQLSRRHPAAALTQVCHGWRELALSTPLLWSRMHISTPGPVSLLDPPSVEDWRRKASELENTIEVWLERSAENPLTVLLDLRHTGIDDAPAFPNAFSAYDSIVALLFKDSQRWKSFDVNVAARSFPLRAFSMNCIHHLKATKDHVPILTSLRLNLAHSESQQGVVWISPALMHTGLFSGPSLRHLKLEGDWDMGGPLRGRIKGWASLTEIEIDALPGPAGSPRFGAYQVLIFLEAVPSLVRASFILRHEGEEEQVATLSSPITRADLQFLSLKGVPMGPDLARFVILPSLTELRLVFDPSRDINGSFDNPTPEPDDNYGEGVLQLLRKFGDQLTTLVLNPEVLSPSSYHSCLEFLNSDRLESLSLTDKHFHAQQARSEEDSSTPGKHLDCLTLAYLTQPHILSNLKHLAMNVRNWRRNGECELALLELIAARRRRMEPTPVSPNLAEGGHIEGVVPIEYEGEELASGRSRYLTEVHVTFTHDSDLNIIQELNSRGVDLRSPSFTMRLNYPNSTIRTDKL